MKHYKGLEGIREATVEELSQIESMNERSARQVYDFFHKEKEEKEAPAVELPDTM